MNQSLHFGQQILIDLEIILKARKTTKIGVAPCSIQELPTEEPLNLMTLFNLSIHNAHHTASTEGDRKGKNTWEEPNCTSMA